VDGVISANLPRAMRLAIVLLVTIVAIPLRAQDAAERPEALPSIDSDTPRTNRDSVEEATDDSQLFTRWLKLDRYGLAFDGAFIYDESGVPVGGRLPGHWGGQHLLNLSVAADLEKVARWDDTTAFLLFQNHGGISANQLSGDEQFFDQLDASPFDYRAQISELWVQKYFCNKKARLKVGKVDANSEFAFVANGNNFIHGAFGNAPTIFLLPTYPDPATSINLFLYPTENLYAGVGMYDGVFAKGGTPGRSGPGSFFSQGVYFFIGEGGVNYELGEDKLDGRVGLGFWGSNAEFRFDGFLQLVQPGATVDPEELFKPIYGTWGWYVVADQKLWKEKPDDKKNPQGVSCFYQFGAADPRVTIFEQYHGVGLDWTGFLKGRDEDAIGMGMAYSRLSPDPRAANFRRKLFVENPANEIAFQWYYKIVLNDNITLQPNLTYIHDPGQQAAYKDALAITFRAVVNF